MHKYLSLIAVTAILSSSCSKKTETQNDSDTVGSDQAVNVKRNWWGLGDKVSYSCAGDSAVLTTPAKNWETTRKTICPGKTLDITMYYSFDAAKLSKCPVPGDANFKDVEKAAELDINYSQSPSQGYFRGFCSKSIFSKCTVSSLTPDGRSYSSYSVDLRCHYKAKIIAYRIDTTDGRNVDRN